MFVLLQKSSTFYLQPLPLVHLVHVIDSNIRSVQLEKPPRKTYSSLSSIRWNYFSKYSPTAFCARSKIFVHVEKTNNK